MMALAVARRIFQLFEVRLAADDAEHAVFVERRVAFAGEDVLAFVFVHDLVDDGLGLMTG